MLTSTNLIPIVNFRHAMLQLQTLFVLLIATSGVLSFTTSVTPHAFNPRGTVLYAKGDEETGGQAIAAPKVGVKIETVTKDKVKSAQKQKSKTSDPVKRREEDFEDAPMYKVMLIGDTDYDQAHVVEKMCEILEDMDEGSAAAVYKQAQKGGQAMCGKYPFEHAELYKEQFGRSDPMIFSDVQED